jgi:hypothetical protein
MQNAGNFRAQHDDVVPYNQGHKLAAVWSYGAITRRLHRPSRVDMLSNASKGTILLLSLPLWLLWRPGQGVHLLPGHGQPLSEADLRAVARPDRHAQRVEVPRVEYEKLSDDRLGEPSAAIRARVEAARERQRWRFEGTNLLTDADTPALAAQVQVWGRRRCGSTVLWMMPAGACCGRWHGFQVVAH